MENAFSIALSNEDTNKMLSKIIKNNFKSDLLTLVAKNIYKNMNIER